MVFNTHGHSLPVSDWRLRAVAKAGKIPRQELADAEDRTKSAFPIALLVAQFPAAIVVTADLETKTHPKGDLASF